MSEPLKIMIVAGEASADVYGGMLAREILRLSPNASLLGFGGGLMAQAGVRVIYPLVDLAIMGIVEVFRHLMTFRRLLALARETLEKERPNAIVLIDYPGFNLRVAAMARELGIPVVYYISPQVWAWRPGRIHKIAQLVDRMLVVFPFEVPLYQKVGCPVEFVGHPLLDVLQGIEAVAKPSRNKRLVGLLPGSRISEVQRTLPVMLRVAERLNAYEPTDFFLPLAPTITRYQVDTYLRRSRVFVKVVTRDTLAWRKAADLALVASGTATLETALMQTPLVILYKVSRINYFIGIRVLRVPYIGLANIIAGKLIVPEFLQHKMRPELIFPKVLALLQDTEERARMKKDLAGVARMLGHGGATRKAAGAILKVIRDKHKRDR